MKRTAYTFTVLRYIHDVVTGEFANVGVALYAPEGRLLSTACASTYGRLSEFFGGVDGEHVKRILRHIEAGIEDLGERLQSTLAFEDPPRDVAQCVARVLPPDDSSLQFSPMGAGTTSNPQATLEELYDRFVERYAQRPQRSGRSDDDVWRIFRHPLSERRVLAKLKPKRIVAPDDEHEFPHAWKNEIWHTAEAVTFDYVEASTVMEKAQRWLGHAMNLSESQEKFKLYLLLGRPRLDKAAAAYARALNTLHKMPCPHEFIAENDCAEFAEMVENELKQHEHEPVE